jgi:hypothetical protein
MDDELSLVDDVNLGSPEPSAPSGVSLSTPTSASFTRPVTGPKGRLSPVSAA